MGLHFEYLRPLIDIVLGHLQPITVQWADTAPQWRARRRCRVSSSVQFSSVDCQSVKLVVRRTVGKM